MPNAVTKERIYDALRLLLAAGGPFSALILRYTGMEQTELDLFVQLALLIVPPAGAWVWGIYLNSIERKVEVISEQSPIVQRQALDKVSDGAKVLIAEAVPNVATVVVKDDAGGNLGQIAGSPQHPNIVTETRNELDAKMGPRSTPELLQELRED
jgi:hypothetical protein